MKEILNRAFEEIAAVHKHDMDVIYGDDEQNVADLAALEGAVDALDRQATLEMYSSEEASSLRRAAFALGEELHWIRAKHDG